MKKKLNKWNTLFLFYRKDKKNGLIITDVAKWNNKLPKKDIKKIIEYVDKCEERSIK